MDHAKMANSIFVNYRNENEDIDVILDDQKRRIKQWKKAREHLQALFTRIDRFFDTPGTLTYHDEKSGKTKGISQKELNEILDLMIEENNHINKAIDREKRQLKQFKEKHQID